MAGRFQLGSLLLQPRLTAASVARTQRCSVEGLASGMIVGGCHQSSSSAAHGIRPHHCASLFPALCSSLDSAELALCEASAAAFEAAGPLDKLHAPDGPQVVATELALVAACASDWLLAARPELLQRMLNACRLAVSLMAAQARCMLLPVQCDCRAAAACLPHCHTWPCLHSAERKQQAPARSAGRHTISRLYCCSLPLQLHDTSQPEEWLATATTVASAASEGHRAAVALLRSGLLDGMLTIPWPALASNQVRWEHHPAGVGIGKLEAVS